MRRSALIAAAAASLALAGAGPASARAGWVIQPTPSLAGSKLLGVSCTPAGSCFAVGNHGSDPFKQVPLAEAWDGSTWTVLPTPHLTATDSTLSGISCAAANSCMAVGFEDPTTNSPEPLAEAWDGSTWTALPTPPTPPGGEFAVLDGVSCTAAVNCTAVGNYSVAATGGDKPLAEHWDGATWTVQPTPTPPLGHMLLVTLDAVSCTSATQCTAVGWHHRPGRSTVTLAERWNGTRWAIQDTHNPAGSFVSRLYGVACSSPAVCTAVGALYTAAASGPLAIRWSHGSWAVMPTPVVPGVTDGIYLAGVSCVSRNNCIAVGNYSNKKAVYKPLAEHWNGSTWALQAAGTPRPGDLLIGDSCASATACIAVGYIGSSFSLSTASLAEQR